MAATGATLQPLPASMRSHSARLPYAWPIYVLFLGFPLWWVLGFSAFIWPVLAIPMTFSLVHREKIKMPRGFGLYLLFFLWMAASGLQLTGPDRIFGFIYRALTYYSAGVMCLYIYNAPKRLLPTRTMVRVMAMFWMIVLAGGILGLLAPTLQFKTVAEGLMPARLLTNDFVYTLVHPASAQVQTFLGYSVPRPTAPFAFTNDWGANFALLVPFLMAAWSMTRSFARRNLMRILAVASLIPVVFSLNRVLWFALAVCMVYSSARFAARGRKGAVQGIAALFGVLFLLYSFGPTSQLIGDRVNTPHSNQGRTVLYNEATSSVLGDSPLLGYGAPRPSKRNPNLPSVGTQGQFWLVFYSHGIPGAFFFVGFFVYAFWRTRQARSSAALWCHVALLVGLIVLPFYGLLTTQIHILAVAIALAYREMSDPDESMTSSPEVVIVAAPATNGRARLNGNSHQALSGGNGDDDGDGLTPWSRISDPPEGWS